MSFQQIDPEALRQLCAAGSCLLVDVRSAPEVQRGYIGGALHIALPSLPQRLDALDRARPVVVYCQSGGRSAQACAFLAANGYTDLYNLQGGIIAWMRAGFAVET